MRRVTAATKITGHPIGGAPQITLVRRSLLQLRPVEAMEGMVKQLAKTKSNAAFLMTVSKFVK